MVIRSTKFLLFVLLQGPITCQAFTVLSCVNKVMDEKTGPPSLWSSFVREDHSSPMKMHTGKSFRFLGLHLGCCSPKQPWTKHTNPGTRVYPRLR